VVPHQPAHPLLWPRWAQALDQLHRRTRRRPAAAALCALRRTRGPGSAIVRPVRGRSLRRVLAEAAAPRQVGERQSGGWEEPPVRPGRGLTVQRPPPGL